MRNSEWILSVFDANTREWTIQLRGGAEDFSQLLGAMLRWQSEGQQVRLEWSDQ